MLLWLQMDVRIAEMRARNRRTAQPGYDAHMSADDMQATREMQSAYL